VNKGLGSDHQVAHVLSQVDKENTWAIANQQFTELAEDPNVQNINENVRNLAGLDVHCAKLMGDERTKALAPKSSGPIQPAVDPNSNFRW